MLCSFFFQAPYTSSPMFMPLRYALLAIAAFFLSGMKGCNRRRRHRHSPKPVAPKHKPATTTPKPVITTPKPVTTTPDSESEDIADLMLTETGTTPEPETENIAETVKPTATDSELNNTLGNRDASGDLLSGEKDEASLNDTISGDGADADQESDSSNLESATNAPEDEVEDFVEALAATAEPEADERGEPVSTTVEPDADNHPESLAAGTDLEAGNTTQRVVAAVEPQADSAADVVTSTSEPGADNLPRPATTGATNSGRADPSGDVDLPLDSKSAREEADDVSPSEESTDEVVADDDDASLASHKSESTSDLEASSPEEEDGSGEVSSSPRASQKDPKECEANYDSDDGQPKFRIIIRRQHLLKAHRLLIKAQCGDMMKEESLTAPKLGAKAADEMNCEQLFALIGITRDSGVEDFKAVCDNKDLSSINLDGAQSSLHPKPQKGGPSVLTGVKRHVTISQEEQWTKAGHAKRGSA